MGNRKLLLSTSGNGMRLEQLTPGAQVRGLAAGADPEHNVLNRPIIAVQLPTSITRDTWRGGDLTTAVLQGIDYILHRAKTARGDDSLPVVINFSYGLFAGPTIGHPDVDKARRLVVGLDPPEDDRHFRSRAMNGTSIAAPQITRWIADRLANGDPSARPAVRALAINEDPLSPPAPPLSAQRGGWGRIGAGGTTRRARSGFTP